MESATRIDRAAERLRRDETVATQFLDWHLKFVRPPRRKVVQAAEGYRQWCAEARTDLLYVDVENPVDVEAFDQQWRVSAEASKIRAGTGWVEISVVMRLFAPFMCVIALLADRPVVAAMAAAVAVVAYVVARTAKPTLLVGPAVRTHPSGSPGRSTGERVSWRSRNAHWGWVMVSPEAALGLGTALEPPPSISVPWRGVAAIALGVRFRPYTAVDRSATEV